MFRAQSLLAGNGAGVTCLRESHEPITTLNVTIYVTPLMVRNFCRLENLLHFCPNEHIYRGLSFLKTIRLVDL